MKNLPITPLNIAGPRLFYKREDLLPYGGGNKVRRLLHWIASHPSCRDVSVISDRGSHMFYTLSQMADRFDSLTFYERRGATSSYREQMRQLYILPRQVKVVEGSLAELWIKTRFSKGATLGMGGYMPESAIAYKAAMAECVQQLQAQGVSGPVVHILPIASGTMADGFLAYLQEHRLDTHRIHGVLTGHYLTHPWLRLRYRSGISLYDRRPMPMNYSGTNQTGIALDPHHSSYAWQLMNQLLKQNLTLILWVTAPKIASDFNQQVLL